MIQSSAFAALATALVALTTALPAASADPIKVDQGPQWTEDQQAQFYVLDQGSRLMPMSWFKALRHADGSRFAERLSRYGFLANANSVSKLPVGFSSAGASGSEVVGLTCAACHTREIEVEGASYRIDGGPALIDFQSFLSDLDAAVTHAVQDASAFDAFASEVLSGGDAAAKAELRQTLSDWHTRNSMWIRQSLQGVTWGLGRLDAVAMIMNRVTGLGLGEPPHFLIADNIKPADAPVRYPFLWNAGHQDRTQWSGFAPNHNKQAALVRNIGQVLGVFGDYRPRKNGNPQTLGVDFITGNSTNITGLFALEGLMRNIGPPRWPWAIDQALADKGEEIYRNTCDRCHAMSPGMPPWLTQVMDAGTDTRQLTLLQRPADPGVLIDVAVPMLQVPPLKKGDRALDVVRVSALGTAIRPPPPTAAGAKEKQALPEIDTPPAPGYEARVLHGIWAAAPYLHNGSVPTLADLLEPAAKRPQSFQVGPIYDRDRVGLAVEQRRNEATLATTDCSDRSSGNSRCGHVWGTDLPDEDKRALLEYLKRL